MSKYDGHKKDNKFLKREREDFDDEPRQKNARRDCDDRHRRDSKDRKNSRDRGNSRNRRNSRDRGDSRDDRHSRDRMSRHGERKPIPVHDRHKRENSHDEVKYSDEIRRRDQEMSRDDRQVDHERNQRWEHKKDDQFQNRRYGKNKPTWGKAGEETKKDIKLLDKDGKPIEKEKPNFETSGKLTEHSNTFNGVVIKYNEPRDARLPKKKHWRLYPYKGTEALKILHLHRQSAFLIGRDRRVADISLDHPSISMQHAVFQFRSVPYTKADGTATRIIRPYIIDLESSNGTFLNNEKISERRFVELREGDMLKFGFSSREYVVMKDDTTEAVLDEIKESDDDSVEE